MRNDDWSEEGEDLGSMNCLMGTTSTNHFRVYSDNRWLLFRKLRQALPHCRPESGQAGPASSVLVPLRGVVGHRAWWPVAARLPRGCEEEGDASPRRTSKMKAGGSAYYIM
ncbi:hypothetical protein E4U61_002969 [Claviceps capensis]|nr:hypothetical protein E4U61_002969 [Claviceps capensis]